MHGLLWRIKYFSMIIFMSETIRKKVMGTLTKIISVLFTDENYNKIFFHSNFLVMK